MPYFHLSWFNIQGWFALFQINIEQLSSLARVNKHDFTGHMTEVTWPGQVDGHFGQRMIGPNAKKLLWNETSFRKTWFIVLICYISYVHSLLWERFKTTNDGSEPHLAQIMNIKADLNGFNYLYNILRELLLKETFAGHRWCWWHHEFVNKISSNQ